MCPLTLAGAASSPWWLRCCSRRPAASGAGAASLGVGQVQLMLHRRLLRDDAKGVNEFLNETACGCTDCHCEGLTVRGLHRVLLPRARSRRRSAPCLRVAGRGPMLAVSPGTQFGPTLLPGDGAKACSVLCEALHELNATASAEVWVMRSGCMRGEHLVRQGGSMAVVTPPCLGSFLGMLLSGIKTVSTAWSCIPRPHIAPYRPLRAVVSTG